MALTTRKSFSIKEDLISIDTDDGCVIIEDVNGTRCNILSQEQSDLLIGNMEEFIKIYKNVKAIH